jgi:hypothetical protein
MSDWISVEWPRASALDSALRAERAIEAQAIEALLATFHRKEKRARAA